MSIDRALVEKIKIRISQHTPEEIQEIAASDGRDGWSAEAIQAATEVLQNRRIGITFEPLPSREVTQSQPETFSRIAWIVAMNAITLPAGLVVLPIPKQVEDNPFSQDCPIPFGPESAWLALDTTDTEAVAKALELQNVQTSSWADGLHGTDRSEVFVTPPLGEWTLVVSASLFPPSQVGEFITILLERLGQQFTDVQYFCTSAKLGLHAWARSQGGQLVRGCKWPEAGTTTPWDVGDPTDEEAQCGLLDPDKIEEAPVEERVLSLARLWSFDPSILDEQFQEPVMGLLGQAPWGR